MPYKMKNRFLIIGLTGPLGSGCTSTAKFLSGFRIYDKSLTELLNEQLNKRRVEKLRDKIIFRYNKIRDLKTIISDRRAKEAGPYWKELVDDPDDPVVNKCMNGLKKEHAKLKFSLRRREVVEVLKDWKDDNSLVYDNINAKDRNLFGFGPFIYISFSSIITKLAFEAFHNTEGKTSFEKYFSTKISAAKTSKSDEYVRLKSVFNDAFDMPTEKWDRFYEANHFIMSRGYQIYIKHSFIDALKVNAFTTKNVKAFYDYLDYVQTSLSNIKEADPQHTKEDYINALSEILQDWGDNLRSTGNPFLSIEPTGNFEIESIYTLSTEINLLIKFLRFRLRFMDKDFNITERTAESEKRPTWFVLECFRNPFEVEYFRSRYSEFYLISLYADKDIRKSRVGYFYDKRDERDQGHKKGTGRIYKLDVRACVLVSDIALLNSFGSTESHRKSFFKYIEKCLRFISLIRMPGCITPEADELFMHLAYSMSLMSTCLSRKVGAVIVGPKGYIYGAGWNDVSEGQIGCGLRRAEDYQQINSIPKASVRREDDFIKALENSSEYVCYKDIQVEMEIARKIETQKDKLETFKEKFIDDLKEDLKIKKLEYCRALHAEENALLQMAKVGGLSVRGGAIYTTTFPCELCAKKIYQTGLNTIYFTEPYPETISEDVFLEDGNRRIEMRPFEGVKSNSFYKLYKPLFDKKDYEIITKQ